MYQFNHRLDFFDQSYLMRNLHGIPKMSSVLSQNVFLRHIDVIMTSVLPFLLYFAAKIVKSSIQIAWKWPIPLFKMFSVRKNEIVVIS